MKATTPNLALRLGRLKLSRRVIGVAVAAVVVIIAGALVAVQALGGASSASTLQTATVERGSLASSVSAAGNIQARQLAALKWGTSGIVGAVPVQVGDVVQAGAALAELDPASLDPAVLRAQANRLGPH